MLYCSIFYKKSHSALRTPIYNFRMPKTIIVLFRDFFQICLFQKRPQDLPGSAALFRLVLLAYATISASLSYSVQTGVTAVIAGLIETVLLLAITWLFLYLRSVPERWLQTSTALAGTGFIFSLFAFPLFYWGVFFSSGPDAKELISISVLILLLWNIAVMSHILSNALSASWLLGVMGSVTYIALISFVLQLVVPVEAVV